MSTTRRTILGSALAAPLLAHFTTTASGATQDATWGTVSAGWIELRWTAEAQAELDRFGVVVDAVAPAVMVRDAEGTGVRLPVRSATGDPAMTEPARAQGSGVLDGGISLRTSTGEFRVTNLESMLQAQQASGKCTVNGIDVGVQQVFTCGVGEAGLRAEPVPAGQPLAIRLTGMPVRPTTEALRAFAGAFGASAFTTATVLAHVSAEGVYTPPQR